MLQAHNYICLSGIVNQTVLRQTADGQWCEATLKYSFWRKDEMHEALIGIRASGSQFAPVLHSHAVGSKIRVEGYLLMTTLTVDGRKTSIPSIVATYVYPELPENLFNRVLLMGNTGNPPEASRLDTGSLALRLSLAVSRVGSAAEREFPNWVALQMVGKTADLMMEYSNRKGARISVVGTLTLNRWQDQLSGEDRSRTVVQVETIRLLDRKADAQPPDAIAAATPACS